MVEIREDVVEQLDKHQETMRLHDFVRIVENDHPSAGPGVSRETLAAYAEAVYFDVDLDAVDERVTDSEAWVEGEHFYAVGEDRISAYPPDWHATLSDVTDVRDVIEVVQREVTEPEGDTREAVTDERGVPEEKILRVAETVADIDRATARDRLRRLAKEDDDVEEFGSQHRNPTFRIS